MAEIRLNIFNRFPYQKWIHISNVLLLVAVGVFYLFGRHINNDSRFILLPMSLKEDPALVFAYIVLVIQSGLIQAIGIIATLVTASCNSKVPERATMAAETTDDDGGGTKTTKKSGLLGRKKKKLVLKILKWYCIVLAFLLVSDVVLGLIWVFRLNVISNSNTYDLTSKSTKSSKDPSSKSRIKNFYKYFDSGARDENPIKGFFYTTTYSFLTIPWVKAIEANFVNRYGIDSGYTKAWDALQIAEECCGYHKPIDFMSTYWFQESLAQSHHSNNNYDKRDISSIDKEERRETNKKDSFELSNSKLYGAGLKVVPFSCCKSILPINPSGFGRRNWKNSPFSGTRGRAVCNPYEYESYTISQRGCSQLLRKWMSESADNLYFIGYCFLSLIKVFALVIVWKERSRLLIVTCNETLGGNYPGTRGRRHYPRRRGGPKSWHDYHHTEDNDGSCTEDNDFTPPLIEEDNETEQYEIAGTNTHHKDDDPSLSKTGENFYSSNHQNNNSYARKDQKVEHLKKTLFSSLVNRFLLTKRITEKMNCFNNVDFVEKNKPKPIPESRVGGFQYSNSHRKKLREGETSFTSKSGIVRKNCSFSKPRSPLSNAPTDLEDSVSCRRKGNEKFQNYGPNELFYREKLMVPIAEEKAIRDEDECFYDQKSITCITADRFNLQQQTYERSEKDRGEKPTSSKNYPVNNNEGKDKSISNYYYGGGGYNKSSKVPPDFNRRLLNYTLPIGGSLSIPDSGIELDNGSIVLSPQDGGPDSAIFHQSKYPTKQNVALNRTIQNPPAQPTYIIYQQPPPSYINPAAPYFLHNANQIPNHHLMIGNPQLYLNNTLPPPSVGGYNTYYQQHHPNIATPQSQIVKPLKI